MGEARRGASSAESPRTLYSAKLSEIIESFHGPTERIPATSLEVFMDTLMKELKTRARWLHGQARAMDATALRRVGFPDASAERVAGELKRRHCLAAIARELGFRGWSHAVAVLQGEESSDFGTLLYPAGAWAHWNIWSASYEEASELRRQTSGYLLAYKHQYFIADRHFIDTLGLDPEDPDWERIGFDWVRPARLEARQRLYRKLIALRFQPQAS